MLNRSVHAVGHGRRDACISATRNGTPALATHKLASLAARLLHVLADG